MFLEELYLQESFGRKEFHDWRTNYGNSEDCCGCAAGRNTADQATRLLDKDVGQDWLGWLGWLEKPGAQV